MEEAARNYRETLRAKSSLYSDFALGLLDNGVLVLPDGRWYVSAVHTDEDIDRTLEAVHSVCTGSGVGSGIIFFAGSIVAKTQPLTMSMAASGISARS